MYALVNREDLPEGKFYETTPDGRCIVPISELRGLTISGIDIVASAAAMANIIEQQTLELKPTVLPELEKDEPTIIPELHEDTTAIIPETDLTTEEGGQYGE